VQYYLSDYTEIPWHHGETRRVPTVTLESQGHFSSLPLGTDHAIVASPYRLKGVHLCDHPKEPTAVPAKILGDYFRCTCVGGTLGVTAAELLMKHHGPGRWPALMPSVHRRHDGGRYQIWLANELIWEMPCVRGGAVFSDTFDRIDEVPLSTGTGVADRWNPISGLTLPNLELEHPPDLTGGRVINHWNALNTERHKAARWNPSNFAFQSDQAASIDAGPLVSTVGILVRIQDDPSTPGQGAQRGYHFYWFQYNPSEVAQQFFLDRMDGSLSSAATLADTTWSSIGFETLGNTLRMEASGSTLRTYCRVQIVGGNDTFFLYAGDPRVPPLPAQTLFGGLALIYTQTDSTYTGGTPGFDLSYRTAGSLGGPRDQVADNFSFEGDSPGSQNTSPTIC